MSEFRVYDFEPDNASSLFDPWAQWIVPEFPFDVLPSPARNFVTTQSAIIGCDPSAMAMAVLAALSGAIDHRFTLKMMRHGQWLVHPRLWVLLVGGSSRKKTPVFNAATRPLEQQEKYLRLNYEAAVKAYLAAGGDLKKGGPPPPPRFVVWDTTIEKLGEILRRNGRGLLVKRDEFAGWIGGMEKYGGGSRGAAADRAFWLQSFDGGGYTVDRIGRGEVFIENLSISLIGGIQPARLAELHGLTSDGLLQRFIPVMMDAAKLPRDSFATDEQYKRLIRDLISLQPRPLNMDDAALDVMNSLRRHLHELEQVSDGLAEGLQAFVGKLTGLAGSLALILDLAADPPENARRPIEKETLEEVQRLVVDFILPHAFEFYRSTESNGDRLKKIASWILTSGKDRIVASDLTSNVADLRGLTLFEVNQRVSPLIAAGWLEPVEPKLGPMNKTWNVNPEVAVQLAERAKFEELREAELAKLMGATRKMPHNFG